MNWSTSPRFPLDAAGAPAVWITGLLGRTVVDQCVARAIGVRHGAERLLAAKLLGHFPDRHRQNGVDDALLAGVGKGPKTIGDGRQLVVER